MNQNNKIKVGINGLVGREIDFSVSLISKNINIVINDLIDINHLHIY